MVPFIEFDNIRFVDLDDSQDSLILTFKFQDGDGDIGIDNNDVFPPYHSFNYAIDADGQFVELGDTSIAYPVILVDRFGEFRWGTFATEEFEFPPFNCKNYTFEEDIFADSLDPDQTDTVLIQQNIYSNNIIVDFYRKRLGVYENITAEFSAAQPNCPETFDSRFPIFDRSNIGRSLEGKISYAMLSSGFKSVLTANDTIRIEFYIFDQALNQSNVAFTEDFTLQGLLER